MIILIDSHYIYLIHYPFINKHGPSKPKVHYDYYNYAQFYISIHYLPSDVQPFNLD